MQGTIERQGEEKAGEIEATEQRGGTTGSRRSDKLVSNGGIVEGKQANGHGGGLEAKQGALGEPQRERERKRERERERRKKKKNAG